MKARAELKPGSDGKAKIRPSAKSVDLMETGLPSNLDAERFVLGSVLLDGSRFGEIATLNPNDFTLERHNCIFRCMQALHGRGEHIDRITMAEELACRGELGPDGLGYLASLDDSMPRISHLDSYVRIVRKKSTLRSAITVAQKLQEACLLDTSLPADILAGHIAQIETLRASCHDRGKIQRVEDLESIFVKRTLVEYLIKPELPAKAIVCLTGDSESGKTTLTCAWAREVLRQGHAVLILDRDKNPRDRICERLERLGTRVCSP